MNHILEQLETIGIIPVIKIENKDDAPALALALKNGGIDAAEVTFRTANAAEAIVAMKKSCPSMLVGAGTIRNTQQAKEAKDAGAAFVITPGFNEDVVRWCIQNEMPVIPGVSTASEIELACKYNLTTLKFFPAESSGGAKKLKDLSAPYPNIKFIPTGGIGIHNLHDYLLLPNVIAIGGSFMVSEEDILHKNWDMIQEKSKKAIEAMLDFSLIHIGINSDNATEAKNTANFLCSLFHFTYYEKPKSHFAGKSFEILNGKGKGEHGHIGIYTPYPFRAMYQLKKQGISFDEQTITRNKITNRVNFVYLTQTISGFGIHLINPDIKM